MPRYGYARVSSTDQDCALQEARLREAGCEVIRAERVSGKSRDGRGELARIMDFLHAGDELVVVKLVSGPPLRRRCRASPGRRTRPPACGRGTGSPWPGDGR